MHCSFPIRAHQHDANTLIDEYSGCSAKTASGQSQSGSTWGLSAVKDHQIQQLLAKPKPIVSDFALNPGTSNRLTTIGVQYSDSDTFKLRPIRPESGWDDSKFKIAVLSAARSTKSLVLNSARQTAPQQLTHATFASCFSATNRMRVNDCFINCVKHFLTNKARRLVFQYQDVGIERRLNRPISVAFHS